MYKRWMGVLAVAISAGLALSTVALAGDCADDNCAGWTMCDSTGNWIEIGGVSSDVQDSADSNEQRGRLDDTWLSSGRLHFPATDFGKDRFELRWQDLQADGGRAWGRIALWPLTIEADSYLIDKTVWDMHESTGPMLMSQENTSDDIKLRWHRGELDNGLLRFERREYNREEQTHGDELPMAEENHSYDFSRLSYRHNFQGAGGRLQGSWSHSIANIDAPRDQIENGEVTTSSLRLVDRLGCDWTLSGRGSVTHYNYDNLPDSSMNASDFGVGLSFKPDVNWEFKADLSSRDNADDNAVSSHVRGSDSYSVQAAYSTGCENRLEAGYRHTSVDYAQLNLRDAQVGALVRGAALVTPDQVAHATTLLTPDLNEIWVAGRWALTDQLTADAKVSFIDGSMPDNQISATDFSSLLYDRRLDQSLNLYYDVNGNDQLAFLYNIKENSNTARGGDFDQRYWQGSWSRCVGDAGYLAFVVSDSHYDLDSHVVAGEWTTDDTTYSANYSQQLSNFDYGLDLSLTDGSGFDEYSQLGLGASLALKDLGPLKLRFDWFDRSYDAQPTLDTQAAEVTVSYNIDL